MRGEHGPGLCSFGRAPPLPRRLDRHRKLRATAQRPKQADYAIAIFRRPIRPRTDSAK